MDRVRGPHIVLLELYATGHHRSYLEMLVDYWLSSELPGRLTLFLSSDFESGHPDFVERLDALEGAGIFQVTYDVNANVSSGGLRALWRTSREHTRAARHVLKTLSPDHLLFMYFDHAQLTVPALAAEALDRGTRLSGIYFRPTFHYEADGARSRLTHLRKRLLAMRAVRSDALYRLFCLDPYVVDPLNRRLRPGRADVAVHVPDGVSRPDVSLTRSEQRARWDCGDDDVVFLFFGSIEPRKGIIHFLDALNQDTALLRDRARFVVAGRIPPEWRVEITARIEKLSSSLRISLDDRYIEDGEMASHFHACDIVLAPYVGHVGSSNVVIRAAAAGKPVIGPTEGLVGRQIRDHRLGVSVDTREPASIHAALVRGVQDAGSLFDRARSSAFAEQNTAEKYARTVLAELQPARNGVQSS